MAESLKMGAVDAEIEVPLLDLGPIHRPIASELKHAVLAVLESNRFIGGPEIERFEQEMAQYCGVEHAIGVSSGTDALIVSLMAMGIGRGDEVIVPAFTFFATAGSVERVGATPVFADIDPVTFNLDPGLLGSLITPRTKAVVPVHLFGQCAEMDPIMEACRKHDIRVIEDAAQAVAAQYHGRMAGSMGDAGCLSFFPSKNLGGIGDGGLVLTNDTALAERILCLKDHGAIRRYHHPFVGGNFRLDAIQAAALRVKLKHLVSWHEERRANAAAYREALADLQEADLIRLPVELQGLRHVFNQFVIRVKGRDELQTYLSARRVGTAVYYPIPLHQQECFRPRGQAPPTLPHSEQAAGEVLALPIFPGLTAAQLHKVTESIREFLLR